MLTFVTYKWEGPDPGRSFPAEAVNVLAASIARHYPEPHRLVCFTDQPRGIDSSVETQPIPETGLEGLASPQRGQAKRPNKRKLWMDNMARRGGYALRRRPRAPAKPPRLFPACYRRLWLFSDAARLLGERIFLLDLDVVVCGDLRPLVAKPGDFVGWHDPRFGWQKIAGGVWMLRTGTHTEVWRDFDPATSPSTALRAGFSGSDQAWISYKLFPPQSYWSARDGLYKIGWVGRELPEGARLVFTAGHSPPWLAAVQEEYPWAKRHWTK